MHNFDARLLKEPFCVLLQLRKRIVSHVMAAKDDQKRGALVISPCFMWSHPSENDLVQLRSTFTTTWLHARSLLACDRFGKSSN